MTRFINSAIWEPHSSRPNDVETESGDVLGKTAVFTAVPGPQAHEFAGGAVHSGRLGVSEEGAGFSFEHAKKCVGANDGFELGLFWRSQLTLGALGSEFVVSGLRLSVGLDADERAGEFEGETPRERVRSRSSAVVAPFAMRER